MNVLILKWYFRKSFLILFAAIFWISTGFSQNLISRESGGNSYFYTDVQDAIDGAQNGDYVYIPGGSFDGDLLINKEVHLVGVGHVPDSTVATGRTVLNGDVVVVTGADGGSLEGVQIDGQLKFGTSAADEEVHNFSFRRVDVVNSVYLGASSPSPVSYVNFNECVLRSDIYGYEAQNVLFSHCFIVYRVHSFNANVTFKNNVFLRVLSNASTYVLYDVVEALFSDNIFLQSTSNLCNQSSSNVFRNNLFVYSTVSSACQSQNINNIFGVALADIFENAPTAVYSQSYDYHLQATCPGVGAGTNGADIGIYGGTYPYKEGAVPFNPHVQLRLIDSQTNGQGELPVNIKVAAQDR
jgi:hypothetical protein